MIQHFYNQNPFRDERYLKNHNKVKGEYFIRKKRISIGRHRENDLRIDDSLISRQHAQIIQQGRTIYLRDLNSTNGTYVAGKRVDIAPLAIGTEVMIGNCRLVFTRSTKNAPAKSPSDESVLDFVATQHS